MHTFANCIRHRRKVYASVFTVKLNDKYKKKTSNFHSQNRLLSENKVHERITFTHLHQYSGNVQIISILSTCRWEAGTTGPPRRCPRASPLESHSCAAVTWRMMLRLVADMRIKRAAIFTILLRICGARWFGELRRDYDLTVKRSVESSVFFLIMFTSSVVF